MDDMTNDKIICLLKSFSAICGDEAPVQEQITAAIRDLSVNKLADRLREELKISMNYRKDLQNDFKKVSKQLAAANARIAELEQRKPSYKAEFDCVYEKLKAEERLSAHYKQKAEQAEAQCAEQSVLREQAELDSEQARKAWLAGMEENRRMREALEEILKFDTNCIGQEYAYRRIKTIAKAALEDVPK